MLRFGRSARICTARRTIDQAAGLTRVHSNRRCTFLPPVDDCAM